MHVKYILNSLIHVIFEVIKVLLEHLVAVESSVRSEYFISH